jgi:hypothetical protein
VAQATVGADGAYSFPAVQASAGYTVSVTPASGMIAAGPATKPADLSASDAVVDFSIRPIVPVAIGGTVRDTNGVPVAGATVELDAGATLTTGPDGTYLFDEAAVGPHTVTVTAPPGL